MRRGYLECGGNHVGDHDLTAATTMVIEPMAR
jgi:hypothetical protein